MKTMYKFFTAIEKLALLPLLFVSISSAQGVFITEIADPQNSADNGRFIELYNSGSADVDLSDGWFLVRWTNANVDIDEILDLSGIIPAGGFISLLMMLQNLIRLVGQMEDPANEAAVNSNGDDNIALVNLKVSSICLATREPMELALWEFEDGRAEKRLGYCR